MMGTILQNRYRIDAELGRGGMGTVYRATDTLTGEPVAVKALNPEVVARDPELLERFAREGQALRQLNHPNIVRMVAAIQEHGQHYLVMEYVDGGSLADLLAVQRRLPGARAIEIALDLADALTRAHRLSIIHRDLKPANVLLAQDGTPRLADFGIAHVERDERLTQTGILVGTVDYLSPEVCQGEPPDECSDIWAFGVMLFEMLTARLPFEGKGLTAKLTSILTQPVPDLAQLAPDVPDALADLVYRMLEKDRQQRIPSVRLVGAELEAMLKGREPVTPSRVTRAETRFATPTPPTNAHAPRHNLPVQATPFIGREAELCELARLLADSSVRVLTIVGVGGMGKTRLALEAGARQLERFTHGVYFVSLAGLEAAEAMVPATAQALGFPFYEGREPRQQLLDYLREKKMLLILDNFEHLLGGVSLVNDILHTASHVLVLSTSRVRLGVPEEHLFHLAGMDFPDWETPADALEYSAVKLFLQSARRVRPGFELAGDDLRYVARICRLVGGMPLGILLAAAWLEMLTPAEIATEMQHSLDFLTTDLPGVSERQRSVRAVLDYSWNSLMEQERSIFRELSVFRGGFTRDAVQAVTGASLRELMGLVNKSLLTRTPAGRYEIHELLRQYGAEKLAEAPEEEQATQDRHCAYYAEFLHQRETHLFGQNQRAVMSEIEAEVDNVRVGWQWAVAHAQVRRMEDYLESVGELYRIHGWSQEGANLFARAAQSLSEAQENVNDRTTQLLCGQLLSWQGRLSDTFDTADNTRRLFQTSVATFRALDARRETAYALCYLGGCEGLYGDANGESFCQEGLSIFQEVGDQRGIALALRGLAWVALHQGDYVLTKQRFQDSLTRFRELGDQKEIARSLGGLGYVCWILGEYQASKQYHEEMLALCKEIGDQGGVARSLGDLGIDTYGLRDYPQAQELWRASLALYREIGNPQGISDELGDLGEGANVIGEYAQAAQLAQESLAVYRKVTNQPYSWGFRVLGNAACGLRDFQEARRCFRQALERAMKNRWMSHTLLILVGIATLLAAEGEKERALELLALVLHHPVSWQMAKDRAAPLIAQLEAELPPNVVAAAQARGRLRDLEATIQELLVELGE